MTDTLSPDQVQFQVKKIQWSDYEHETPILLQDANGPCPLIALVNTLLLQNEIDIRNHQLGLVPDANTKRIDTIGTLKLLLQTHSGKYIGLTKVLGQLGDILLELNNNSGEEDEELSLHKLLNSLPLLHTGLTVNPNIINGEFPENDLSSILFRKFGLNFKHGWIFDDTDSLEYSDFDGLADILNNLQTFDKIQDFLLIEADGDTKLQNDKQLITKWLELNQTQLTKNGLTKLDYTLQTDDFIIFFRNNHFSTLFKRNDNDFYLLITDDAFRSSSNQKIVWQSLISVSGKDDLFFTGDFIPVFGDETFDIGGASDENVLLAKQLQEEDDQALAKELQQRYNKKPEKSKAKDKLKKSKEKTDDDDKKKEKKKRDCIIT